MVGSSMGMSVMGPGWDQREAASGGPSALGGGSGHFAQSLFRTLGPRNSVRTFAQMFAGLMSAQVKMGLKHCTFLTPCCPRLPGNHTAEKGPPDRDLSEAKALFVVFKDFCPPTNS